MTQPTSITNDVGQNLDTLFDPATGNGVLKIAVGDKALSGKAPHVSWQGVATHKDADTFVAADPVLLLGGYLAADGKVHKLLVDANSYLKVSPLTPTGTLTDWSGTLAVGGTADTLMPANATRVYMFIQNVDPVEEMWIDFTTNAVISQPSIRLGPGDSFESTTFCSTELVSVNAATTAHPWTAKEA